MLLPLVWFQEWRKFMTTKTVRKSVQEESEKLNWQYIRLEQREVQSKALEPYGIDTFGALAVRSFLVLVSHGIMYQAYNNITTIFALRIRPQPQPQPQPALSVHTAVRPCTGEADSVFTNI